MSNHNTGEIRLTVSADTAAFISKLETAKTNLREFAALSKELALPDAVTKARHRLDVLGFVMKHFYSETKGINGPHTKALLESLVEAASKLTAFTEA